MSANRVRRASRDLAKKQLEMLGSIAGVQSAVLFSADGFEIASHATDASAASRLAAIGSSLAALGVAISAEAGLQEFERTTIESKNGTVMIMRVETTRRCRSPSSPAATRCSDNCSGPPGIAARHWPE